MSGSKVMNLIVLVVFMCGHVGTWSGVNLRDEMVSVKHDQYWT